MPITLPVPGGGGTTNQQAYYNGSNLGEYQFVSLQEIIDNFMATYVGEGKILNGVLSGDVVFHAHRALQELHYDTLKSCKSQEIEICPNLKMPLPHDYVNYVKLTTVDSNGIEHVLYPTSKTSNPFAIEQLDSDCDSCGDTSSSYRYSHGELKPQEIECGTEDVTCSFNFDPFVLDDHKSASVIKEYVNNRLPSNHPVVLANPSGSTYNYGGSSNLNELTLLQADLYWQLWKGLVDEYCLCLEKNGAVVNCGQQLDWNNFNPYVTNMYHQIGTNGGWANFRILGGSLPTINRTTVNMGIWPDETTNVTASTPTSNTWDNYKSSGGNSIAIDQSTTSSNVVDADNYFQNTGRRYGIDPQHAQTNGSYFMDCIKGMIHFSSNLSGKTVILKYISDGHGTSDEAIVPKLAEEAMYKWIAYGCLSARLEVPDYLVQRFKREKIAETRKAKIRLSNIKIEEISQVFRGKSKWIKH